MTTNWTSRVKQGRNIAVENSFRIRYENNSFQKARIGLFSLGSNNITQATNTQTNSLFLNIDLGLYIGTNQKFTIAAQYVIYQTYLGANPLYYGQSLEVARTNVGQIPIGTLVTDLPNTNMLNSIYTIPNSGTYTVNIVPTTNGQFTDLDNNFCSQWYVQVRDAANRIYDFLFPNVTINRTQGRNFPFTGIILWDNSDAQISQSSLDSNNPFVQTVTQTPVSVGAIQQSSNGGTLGVLCLDIYSNNKEQVLQSVDYQYKDSNGNTIFFGSDPIINPYQPQVGSISCLDLDMVQINNETTVFYNVLPNSSALLTFNYVKFSIWDYYEFDRVFAQQLRDNFLLQKKLLDRGRLSLLQIE